MLSKIKFVLYAVSFIAIAFIASTEGWATGLEKSLLCPVCEINFKFIKIAKKVNGRVYLDGKPVNNQFPVLPECPMCKGVFPEKLRSEKFLNKLKKYLWSEEFKQIKSASSWFRYANILSEISDDEYEIGQAFLTSAWEADAQNKPSRAALLRSLKSFNNFLTINELENPRYAEVFFKVGEIYRQLNQFEKARKHFAELDENSELKQRFVPAILELENKLIFQKNSSPALLPSGNKLHKAVIAKDLKLCRKLLLENPAWLNEINSAGKTPLLIAVKAGSNDLIRLLVKHGANVNFADLNGNSVFHMLAQKNNSAMTHFFIKAGAKFDVVNNAGRYPIHEAFVYGNLGVARVLINAGCSVTKLDLSGNSLLHLACNRSDSKAMKLLQMIAGKGLKVNQRNFNDETPLMIAAKTSSEEVIASLVNHGANINARLPNGATSLFFCKEELIPILIKLGADINLTNNKGSTAAVSARLNLNSKRIEAFQKLSSKGNGIREISVSGKKTNIFKAIKAKKLRLVEKIVRSFSDQLNVKSSNLGETPLLCAILEKDIAIIKFLLKNKADVNLANDLGRSPLHYAALSGDMEIVKLLCDNDANVFALDARGNTALHDAASVGAKSIYKFLIQRGASSQTKNNKGKSPKELLAYTK